jgi:hypothetical protein
MNMATAKRLYLYGVSAAALSMLIGASIAMLHLLLSKVGVGPQGLPGAPLITDMDRQILAGAIPVGVIGLVLWLTHWFLVERMVRKPGDEGAAERASIVRAVYFKAALSTALLVTAVLAVQLIGNSLGNLIDKTPVPSYLNYTSIYSAPLQFVDDAWSLAIIIVALGAWGYHALVRARDLRQGTFIGGAAAWVSRFYLYGAALVGLWTVLGSIAAIITTFGAELFKDNSNGIATNTSSTPEWVRPIIAAVVSLVIWGAIWLIHLVYSNRLRSGRGNATQQNAAERTSKVRLAFFMLVVVMGALTAMEALGMSLGVLFDKLFGDTIASSTFGYDLVVPPLAAVPAVLAWFLHRRRGISESAENATEPSGRRISSYVVATAAVYVFAAGAVAALAAVFGQVFAASATSSVPYSYGPAFEFWKTELAYGLGILLVGIVFWVWPWLSAQRRRRADGEIGSTSRSFYLYSVSGFFIVIGAGSLAAIAFLYLRLALGLTDTSLGSEISTPLALLIPAVALFAFHALLLRGDTKPRLSPTAGTPVAPTWPTWPGSPGYPGSAAYSAPGAFPPAGPVYGATQGYPPAGPAQYPPAGPTYGAPQGYPPAAPMYAPPSAYAPAPPMAPAAAVAPAATPAPWATPAPETAPTPAPWATPAPETAPWATPAPEPAPAPTTEPEPAPDDSPEAGA